MINIKIKELSVKNRILLCAAILAFGGACWEGFILLKKKPEGKAASELIKSVFVQAIVPEDIYVKISGYGTAKPRDEITVSAEVKGRADSVNPYLKAGKTVSKDEVLVNIDDSDYKITFAEANAELERLNGEKIISAQTLEDLKSQFQSVKNIFDLEKKEYERTLLLYKKNVSNQSDLNRAAQTYASKEKDFIDMRNKITTEEVRQKTIGAQINKAEEEKKMAALNIARSTIKAPFAGRLKEVFVEKDEYVIPGTKLFTLVDDDDLEITVPLDSFDAVKSLGIKRDETQNWFKIPESVSAVIEWAQTPDSCRWEGKIIRLESFNPETRTLDIVVKPVKEISSAKDTFPLVDGMFCKVTFTGLKLDNAVRIPWSALQHERDVFTVDKDNRLLEKNITVFMAEDKSIIVSSGLEKGDRIVIQRLPSGIVNGSKIRPILSK